MLSCGAVPGTLLRQGQSAGALPRLLLQRVSAGRNGGTGVALSRGACTAIGLGGKIESRVAGDYFRPKAVAENGAGPAKAEVTRQGSAARGLSKDSRGGIHLIIGPMFAGKSTALLQRVQEEARNGRRVALVKSDKDTRYGPSAVVTHDGLQMPCFAVPNLATFKGIVGGEKYNELEVIGIDEAQFFTDLREFCQTAADFESKTLIVAGLDGDFLRRKFGSTVDLIPVADSVVKLSSRCEICGKPASFSFRKTLNTSTELVGGADIYMPVCRQHYVNGQIVVETASTVMGAQKVTQMSKD